MAQILVLESHRDLRCVLGEALEAEGHDVRLSASVADALAALHAARPDLVLCDLQSGGETTQSFVEWCRAQPAGARVPVVLMSADPAATALAQRHGCAQLPKPFDLDDLLGSIGAALRNDSATPRPESVGS